MTVAVVAFYRAGVGAVVEEEQRTQIFGCVVHVYVDDDLANGRRLAYVRLRFNAAIQRVVAAFVICTSGISYIHVKQRMHSAKVAVIALIVAQASILMYSGGSVVVVFIGGWNGKPAVGRLEEVDVVLCCVFNLAALVFFFCQINFFRVVQTIAGTVCVNCWIYERIVERLLAARAVKSIVFGFGGVPVDVVDVFGDEVLHLLPKRSVVGRLDLFPNGVQNHFAV